MRTSKHETDKSEHRYVRKWRIAVIGCYGAVLAAFVAVMILSQAASNWVAAAAQAEMRDHGRPAAEQTQLTMTKH